MSRFRSLLDTAKFKHGTAAEVMGNLRKDVTSCEERKCRRAQVHSALFARRRTAMKDVEVIYITYMKKYNRGFLITFIIRFRPLH